MAKRPHWIDNPLREYRLQNYLLQVEAAKRCGMDGSMWSLLESLKRSPSLVMANRISKRTGIPIQDIARFFARRKTVANGVVRGSGVDLRDRTKT